MKDDETAAVAPPATSASPPARLTARRPDFICIGAPASGCEWLRRQLLDHPSIFVPRSDTRFFERMFECGIEGYEALFRDHTKPIAGDISSSYACLRPERIRFIHDHMPDAKVVFLMRNPVTRAWADARQKLAKQRRERQVARKDAVAQLTSSGNLRRGDYERMLARWLGEYPERQFFIGFYEDIQRAPHDFLARLFRFLGLPDTAAQIPIEDDPDAAAEPIPADLLEPLYVRHMPLIERLAKRFGGTAETWTSVRPVSDGAAPLRKQVIADFLIVGMQFCGVRWLSRVLALHPRIWGTQQQRDRNATANAEALVTVDDTFGEAEGRLCGVAATQLAMAFPEHIYEIKRQNPSAKIILMLRDPVQRSWNQAISDLAVVYGRGCDIPPDAVWHRMSSRTVSRSADYDSILGNWLSVFPREQVFVGLYEDALQRPVTLINRLCEFLNVPPLPNVPGMRLEEMEAEAEIPSAFKAIAAERLAPQIKALQDQYSVHFARTNVAVSPPAQHLAKARSFRPTFLGIGAQKAGTTWLHHNLAAHADTFLPPEKELHFFDRNLEGGITWYATMFAEAAGKIAGEITPAYSVMPRERIQFVRQMFPEVRLLFLMRNPVERAWSHAIMTLVTKPGRRYEDVREAEFTSHFNSSSSRRRGDYESIIDSWLEFFPSEQLFVGMYDDIAKQPRTLMEAVIKHIGLSVPDTWDAYPLNKKFLAGPGIEMPPQYRSILLDIYAPAINRLAMRFGPSVHPWLA